MVSRIDAPFTSRELTYLRDQQIGRLATVDGRHAPQVVPVGYSVDEATGEISIGGTALGSSRKFRNVQANPQAALVVDDVTSTDPWQVRGVEVRGAAAALTDVQPPMAGLSPEQIRITPRRIRSWGLESIALSDAEEIGDLLVSYFRGFDERRSDRDFHAAVFTEDASVRFPAGEADGLDHIVAAKQDILALWARTHHLVSDISVAVDGGSADVTATLEAIHHHRADDPGDPLEIRARVSGTARRVADGWRLAHLELKLLSTQGDGPSRPA